LAQSADQKQVQGVALVTGANRGIGRATAQQLSEAGFTVVVGARSIAEAQEAAQEIASFTGADVLPVKLDITRATDRSSVAAFIKEHFDRLDVLVNNAAIGVPEGMGSVMQAVTADTTLEELREVFETNLFATVALTHDLLPLLRKSDAGRIVNVSSQIGSLQLHARKDPAVAYTKRFSHNASKAALNLFTILLAEELEGTRIKVNSVHPGWVKTRLGTDAAPLDTAAGAATSVKAALLRSDGPSGQFFHGDDQVPW
jgi:NAD(P)-dependent dehydrogenase (short-subunit alcohol dehydrogenase family)